MDPVIRPGIMQVEVDPQAPSGDQLADPSLGGGDLGVDGKRIPVSVVVPRFGLLAARTASDVVHIHNRHDEQLRAATEGDGLAVVARQPVEKAAGAPASSGFPGMLAGVNPHRRARAAGAEAHADHGAALP